MSSLVRVERFSKTLKGEYGLRFDPLHILNYEGYTTLLNELKREGVCIVKFSDILKGRIENITGKTATILIRSLWKASIHPLKIQLRESGRRLKCDEQDVVFVATGLGSIGKVSIVPHYITKIVNVPIATTPDLFILHPHSDRLNIPYYITALANTRFGRIMINMLTYGSTGQLHLDTRWLEKVKIPIVDSWRHIASVMRNAIEYYEAKAWSAYFRAMKVIEEYLNMPPIEHTGFSTLKDFVFFGRLDPKFFIHINVLKRLPSVKIVPAKKLFDVKLGTAPRSRRYKIEKGEAYISYDAIDESGIIDEDLFYRLPKPPKRTTRASKYSVLITSVAHGIEGIGKVGIVFPHSNILCMAGLAVFNPSQHKIGKICHEIACIEGRSLREIMLYTFAALKSRLMKRIMQSLTYGLTAQISKKDLENLPIPIIENILNSEVPAQIEDFLKNMIEADKLKKQAIKALESDIFKSAA